MSEPAWVALGTAELEVDAVEHDEVTVAGVRLLATKLVAGDAQPAFRIYGNGSLEWGGGGGTPPDAALVRIAPDVMRFYNRLDLERTDTTSNAFIITVEGEATGRFSILNDGSIQWGEGATARDITLKRNGAGVLGLDAALSFGRPSESNPFIYAAKTGDANARFTLQADGKLGWGPGTGAIDTNLYRGSGDVLKTDDTLHVGGNAIALTGANGYVQARAHTGAGFAFLVSQVVGESFDRSQFFPGTIRHGAGTIAPVQVVGARVTGWVGPTGTAARSTFLTSTVTLEVLAQHVKALIDDLTTHGLIGA